MAKRSRAENKQIALTEARDIIVTREHLWPSVVPQSVILQRLNEYMDATVWTDPPICTSRTITVDKMNISSENVSFKASFEISMHVVALRICPKCKSALSRGRLPALALANGLFRGQLPDQFRDLTWVEEKPRVFHGNMCAHDLNVFVVLIGPEKFDPKRMRSLFRVRKQKRWDFLIWLKHHNHLYADIPLDSSLIDLYPVDGILPGLQQRVVEDHELDAQFVFNTETAGFSEHPASMIQASPSDVETHADLQDDLSMVEKMGVSDPESANVSGRQFTASALRNLIPDSAQSLEPNLVIHHGSSPVTDYHNPRLFPGLYPTLYPYGLGGFEDHSRVTPLSIERQAKYFLNLSDRAFRYHDAFIFCGKSNFDSVARSLTSVSSNVLRTLADRLEQECKVSSLTPEEQNAFKLLRQVNTMSTVSQVHSHPRYFAAHSPIFQVMYGDQAVDLSAHFPFVPPSRTRAIRLAHDPVAAAEFLRVLV
ncbi:hypothetical protein DFJ58DRAFT_739661 [Suillus subalutaceus]|uniref:uncharacterized protein n=1 Tax=Suillus subalutaceus TaxID=48586 RepID=UPI001B87398C|nr:uncharacterized protein DFJ58DRAFT_739661 [Suillus subalutaceus]KAG1816970.1 hypothetical protein DFJ58DRAFT_739661 [Suillus subalutaceus]